MSKTSKFVILVLALNVALIGALHWLSSKPSKTPVAPETQMDNAPKSVSPQPAHPDLARDSSVKNVVAVAPSATPALDSAAPPTDDPDAMRDWARNNPDAAIAWAAKQPDGPQKLQVLTDACFQIALGDPARAVSVANQYHLTAGATLENLTQQWAAKDLTAAFNWSMSQPAGDQRDGLLSRVTFIWSQSDPAAAARIVAEQMPPGPAQDEAAMTVVHQWAMQDFNAANAWVQQFPQGAFHDRAQRELNGILSYQQDMAKSAAN